MNRWPDGYRHAMSQAAHEKWNACNYPGTLQICFFCDEPTGRCEEDSIYIDEDSEPVCEKCYEAKGETG
jgi:hypothetical protein